MSNVYGKIFSNYVTNTLDDRTHSSCERVTVKSASATEIHPFGVPVISDGAGSFKLYEATDDIATVAAAASSLSDGSPIAVLVGDATGMGQYTEDLKLDATGVEATVVYRDATVVDNLDWSLTGTPAEIEAAKAAFYLQLQKQRVKVVSLGVVANPTNLSPSA